MNEIIEEKLRLLPGLPGVYKMYDASGTVIYVGKAVSLKNRVRQYFHSSKNHTPKVRAMVSHIADFDTILVSNETEALSLESNLIKQFRPKYNILLKDDKHFPYVRIDIRQDFPRVEIVRKIKNDGAKYIGPFLSAMVLKDAMNIVREHFPIRHCRKDLKRAIERRERPCLMHHLGKCCAPCSGTVSRKDYHAIINNVASFLNGNTDEIISYLTDKMTECAISEQFERAAQYRDAIMGIRKMNDKQVVINTAENSLDVFALSERNGEHMVFAMFIRNGKVIGTEKFRMDADQESNGGEILTAFLQQFYLESATIPPEILLNETIPEMEHMEQWLNSLRTKKVTLHVPVRGDKKKLISMAIDNCNASLEKEEQLRNRAFERGDGALAELTVLLGLDALPERMECFDNSHIMGRDTVASMVVFTNSQPDHDAYRRFRIQSDANGDDLIAMREVLTRRFQAFLDGKKGFDVLPDLLVIDGGQTQLQVACDVLTELGLTYINVIGLAEQHELIYQPGIQDPIVLPRSSSPLHLLERLRDEAHRFAIQYHRTLRQKNALFSVLDEIEGVGDKRKRALFDKYMTLDAIKAASMEDLATTPGITKPCAEQIYNHFHS